LSASRFSQIVWASIASYVELGLYLLSGILVARSLGPAEYGKYAYGVWMIGVMITISTNGLSISAIQQISAARGNCDSLRALQLSASFSRWQNVAASIVCLCSIPIIWLSSRNEWGNQAIWFVIIAVTSAYARTRLLNTVSIAKGYEDFRLGNISGAFGATICVMLVVLWSFLQNSLLGYLVIYLVSGILACIWAELKFRRRLRLNERLDRIEERSVLKRTLYTSAVFILGIFVGRYIETAILKYSHGSTIVGFYVIALTLSKGFCDIMVSGFDKVLLPTVSKVFSNFSKADLNNLFDQTVRVYWFLGLMTAGFGALCAKDIVVFLYGSAFLQASFVTALCMIITGLSILVGATNAFLLNGNKHKERMWGGALALMANLLIAILAVPAQGLEGAVAALAAGFSTQIFVGFYLVKRFFGIRPNWINLLKALLTAVVSALLSWYAVGNFSGGIAIPVKLMVFIAFLIILLIATRYWKRSELILIASIAEARLSKSSRLSRVMVKVSNRFGAEG
jgi:O-antigen/teichoic acid export membrane protein